MKAGQVLVVLLPVLDGHELLPCPVIEATTAVALTGEFTEPHLVAAVAGAGLHTALLVPLDVFNHRKVNTQKNDKTGSKYDKTNVTIL